MDEARRVREFWFGKLPLGREALAERMQLWFAGGESRQLRQENDAALRAEFAPRVEAALRGELASWADGPRRRLSLILLLDQFPRNIYRGRARAFAGDDAAVGLALSGMQSGADAALDPVERIFFYMPMQHAEARDIQEESLAAVRRLVSEAPPELAGVFASVDRFARLHAQIIEHFGRFPHRNRVLGRESTSAELSWLAAAGQHFGQ
jgi:uncharacterized protein (DUF924 family)